MRKCFLFFSKMSLFRMQSFYYNQTLSQYITIYHSNKVCGSKISSPFVSFYAIYNLNLQRTSQSYTVINLKSGILADLLLRSTLKTSLSTDTLSSWSNRVWLCGIEKLCHSSTNPIISSFKSLSEIRVKRSTESCSHWNTSTNGK